MLRHAEFDALFKKLGKVLDQAKAMELDHLNFLLSMALREAKQQRLAVCAPLRLVVGKARASGREG